MQTLKGHTDKERKGYLQVVLLLLCLFFGFNSIHAQNSPDFEDEKEMIKMAEKHFDKKEYAEALSMYSQLAATYPNNHEYNFKYGTCLHFASEDKASPILFLSYAVESSEIDPLALYYLARSYHLSYRFDQAIKYYELFQRKGSGKDVKEFTISRKIEQCENAKKLVKNVREISVYDKKTVADAEFFRSYRLNEFRGDLIVVPEDFQSKNDLKEGFSTVIMNRPSSETIFYASTGKDGLGSSDIYQRNRLPDGTWGEPLSVGYSINTRYEENYPYLHPNGTTLYFCSKGHNSIGGYDIFKSELDTLSGIWGTPENLGFAINSPGDDYLFISDEYERVAYFASNRANRANEISVFKIKLSDGSQENVLVSGVFKRDDNLYKEKAITVFDKQTGSIIGVFESDRDGEFYMTLPADKELVYQVEIENGELLKQDLGKIQDDDGILNQSLEITSKPTPSMAIINLDAEEESKDIADILAGSGRLQVNRTDTIEFNEEPKEQPKPVDQSDEFLEKADFTDADSPTTNKSIVEGAFADADELQSEADKLLVKSDVAYMIASDKNDQVRLLVNEINQQKKELNQTSDKSQKQFLEESIASKQSELKELKEEVIMTYDIAKQIEAKYVKKQEDATFSRQYANDLQEAITSPSAEEAIVKLEKTREKLEEIYANKEPELSVGSMKQEVSSNIESTESSLVTLDDELIAIADEKSILNEQMANSNESHVQDALQVEIEELEEEENKLKSEKDVLKRQLNRLNKQMASMTNDPSDIQEIVSAESAINSVEDVKKIKAAKTSLGDDVLVYDTKSEEELLVLLAEKENQEELPTSDDKSADDLEEYYADLEIKEKGTSEDQLKELGNRQEKISSINYTKSEQIALLEKNLARTEDPIVREAIQKDINRLKQEQASGEELIVSIDKRKEEIEEKLSSESETNNEEVVETIDSDETVDDSSLVFFDEILDQGISDSVPFETMIKGVELAFGIKTNPDFDYGKDQLVQANLRSGNRVEQQAFKTYLEAKELQRQADAETSSRKAQSLIEELIEKEEEAKELQLKASENYSLANRRETEFNSETLWLLEDLLSANEKSKIKEVERSLSLSDSLRNLVGITYQFEDKVKLINEAYQLELDAIAAQKSILKRFEVKTPEEAKVIVEPEKGDSLSGETEDLIANTDIEQVETITDNSEVFDPIEPEKVDNEIVTTNDSQPSVPEEELDSVQLFFGDILSQSIPDTVPSETVNKGVQLAFGIITNTNFEYGKDQLVQANLKSGDRVQEKAFRAYIEAKKIQAEADTETSVKKAQALTEQLIEKEEEAKELQLKASENYSIANKREAVFNAETLGVLNSLLTDEEQIKVNKTETLLSQSDSLRNLIGVTVLFEDKVQLINKAYALELEAIKTQKSVLKRFEVSSPEEAMTMVDPKSEGGNVVEEDIDYESMSANEISYLSKEELSNVSLEKLNKSALELRKQASSDRGREAEDLVVLAQVIEEVAIGKQLAKARVKFDQLLQYSFKNQQVIRRVALVNQSNQNLVLANMIKNEVDSYLKEIENGRVELQSYIDGQSKLAAYQQLAITQKKLLEKEKAAIELYIQENANTSDADIAYFNSLNLDELNALDSNDEDLLNFSSDNPVEVVELDSSSEDDTQLVTDVTSTNKKEENTLAQQDDKVEPELTTDEDVVVNELTDQQDIPTDFQEEVAVNDVTQDMKDVTVNSEEERLKQLYNQYNAKITEAESNYQEAERLIAEALSFQSQGDQLQSMSDNLLASAESSKTEEEITQLIQKADQLRLQANEKYAEANKQAELADNFFNDSQNKLNEANAIIAEAKGDNGEVGAMMASFDYQRLKSMRNDLTAAQNKPKVSGEVVNTEVNASSDKKVEVVVSASLTSSIISFDSKITYSEENPIPIDPAMPEGLVFKVQVGAFKNKIPQDLFNGISPVVGETTKFGFIRYTAGKFSGFEPANIAKREIRSIGYKDAFVVAYFNGKRISLSEALRMVEEETGTAKTNRTEKVREEVEVLRKAGVGENYTPPTVNQVAQNVKDLKGILFTVQIGFYSEPVAPKDLYNLDPILQEDVSSGYRYMHGVFKESKDASRRKNEIREIGISDAFVTAYRDGKKISVEEANEIINNGAESVNTDDFENAVSVNKGIEYKVQIGAYSKEVPVKTAMIFIQFAKEGVTHWNKSGITIYSVGSYNTYKEAEDLKQIVRGAGISDAFVTVYKDGVRIKMSEVR